jgi:hypothetical protein
MATHTSTSRLALRDHVAADRTMPYGAWWPESRQLSDQLGELMTLWPPEEGRVARVLYSPPDWDDHPRSVAVPGRTIKTGSFPHDDTHRLTLALFDGSRRSIRVIAPNTPTPEAREILDGVQDTPGVEGHVDGPL